MTIEREQTFSLNGVTSNYCVKIVGTTTVAALAEIRIRPTSNRKGPPKCGNGFETARLAFAKGHVVALELGGSDKASNVVPQFEHWQGKPNGAWRQMEEELKAHHGKMMLVTIGYGRTGGERDYDGMVDEFQDNHLVDWTDVRIPDSFEVRVWPNAGVDPANIESDQDFEEAVAKLKKTGPSYSKDFALGNQMPQPDRQMYVEQYGIGVAKDLYEGRPPLHRETSIMSYLLLEGTLDDIRVEMKDVPDVTPTEAAGLHVYPLMKGIQGITEPKARAKHKLTSQKKGVKVISSELLEQGMKRKAADDLVTGRPEKNTKK